MRFVFLLVLTLNLGLFAFGQGLFGPPPSERGRDVRPLAERNAQAMTLQPAQLDNPGRTTPEGS